MSLLDTITVEDMAGQARELLAIKYADPRTRAVRDKLLRRRDRKVVEVALAPHPPLVCTFERDSFSVTTGTPARSDLRVAIPMRDVTGLLRFRLPLRSLLRGRIRFRGSLRDALALAKMLRVEVGDPAAAYAFVRHYFLDG